MKKAVLAVFSEKFDRNLKLIRMDERDQSKERVSNIEEWIILLKLRGRNLLIFILSAYA